MKSGSITPGTQGTITGTLYYTKNGTLYSIAINPSSQTWDDFSASSPSFRTGTSEGNTISIGSACIGEFSCNLNNDTGKFNGVVWKGAYLELKVTCGSTTLDFGTYYVNKSTESGQMISLTCYDAMELFDEHRISEDNIDWSQNSNTIVSDICKARLNQTYSGSLDSFTLEEPENLKNITERAFISYMAQMSGKFAIIRNGVLTFDWYNTNRSSAYDAGTTFSHELQANDVTIKGVKITSYDGEVTASAGDSDEYIVTITDNPFITQDNVESVGNNILSHVNGLTFRPGNFSIECNPAIEAGDALLIDTSSEDGIFTLATSVTYKTATTTEQITADAQDETQDARLSQDDYIKQYGGSGGACNHPDAEEVYW